jgi:hypothetical protein
MCYAIRITLKIVYLTQAILIPWLSCIVKYRLAFENIAIAAKSHYPPGASGWP